MRVAGRHIVYFREVAAETDEIDEESVTTLQPDSVIGNSPFLLAEI